MFLVGFNIFAEGKFPNKHQFEVKNPDDRIFELDSDVQNIFDVLGEPLKKENLWVVYPNASCALYRVVFDVDVETQECNSIYVNWNVDN